MVVVLGGLKSILLTLASSIVQVKYLEYETR